MTKPKNPTRKQHWLPETSHIGQFANEDGVVQVYRYENHSKDMLINAKHFPSSPNGIGFEKDLYERPDLPPNTVEDNLAKIEGKFGRVLNEKIIAGKRLSEQEREIVVQYIGLLQFRTPREREHLAGFLQEMRDMGRQISIAYGSPEAGERFAAEVDNAEKVMFTEQMAIAQDVAHWRQLDWCYLKIPDYMSDVEFITSDHPVSVFDFADNNSPYGVHPWNKTAENIVALTPNLALFGNRVGITGYKNVNYNILREVNFRTVSASRNMVISHKPISDHEKDVIINRFPQSLIVRYLKLPDGRADRFLKKQTKDEENVG